MLIPYPLPHRVTVLGAGVVGVATAWALASRGVAVTIVDAAAAPGCGASFANGAQLSYVYTDALASPALLRHAPAVMAGLDPAIRLAPRLDPDSIRWLLRLLRNMTPGRFRANTLAALQLGLESRVALHDLMARHPLDFGHAAPGKLHVHAGADSFRAAQAMVAAKRAAGAEQAVLSAAEARALVPALAARRDPVVGAILSPQEEVGDPQRFCVALLAVLAGDYGVQVRLNTAAAYIDDDAGIVTAAGERITADALVVCAGMASARLLRRWGLGSALLPMKGYSLTMPAGPEALALSITDVARKIVICPLGGRIRVAGGAELGVSDASIVPAALSRLQSAAVSALPGVADFAAAGAGWAGLRPMTANSQPIIRRVAPRIHANIGHGMLGWTFAMGTAHRLVQNMTEVGA